MGRAVRGDRGAGTAVTGMMALLIAVVSLVAIMYLGWLASVERARSAADLAALAGAGAELRGQDACVVASRTAEANGARLVACDVSGGRFDLRVAVEVATELRPVVGGFHREARETAVAGTDGVVAGGVSIRP